MDPLRMYGSFGLAAKMSGSGSGFGLRYCTNGGIALPPASQSMCTKASV
jgi:hypothetical protein